MSETEEFESIITAMVFDGMTPEEIAAQAKLIAEAAQREIGAIR
jgi:hypothetical protein